MSAFIIGLVVLVLAALVVIWIAYCMFVRERPKPEFLHRNITELQRRNDKLDQTVDEAPTKKEMAVVHTCCSMLQPCDKQKNEKKKESEKSPPLLIALEKMMQAQKK